MRESFEKLMEGINNCIDQAFKQIGWGCLKEMDAEEFTFMQSAMRLMDDTKSRFLIFYMTDTMRLLRSLTGISYKVSDLTLYSIWINVGILNHKSRNKQAFL